MTRAALALAAGIGCIATLAVAGGASAKCGVERWPVKIAADQAVPTSINPRSTTIAALSAIPAPANPDANQATRFAPTETTLFTLDATMTLIKHEADGDYHIVLRDGTATMIVEAPDPACAKASRLPDQIAKVRADIDRHFGGAVKGRKANLSIPVSVTGIGFFDLCHGQEGRAPNCIELHPILAITFRAAP